MRNFKKHIAMLLVLVMVLALVPTGIATATQRTYTLERDGFVLEFNVVSWWNTGYNANIVIRNNTSEDLYQWVLNLNRDMGLLENGVQGGKLAFQESGVTTIGYIDWNSTIIPAGGYITLWLTNTRTNGTVPVPTDFRIKQATRRRVPSEDYTQSVAYHNEWAGRFGLGISTVNVSDRVIQGWELEFDINGRVETTSIGTLTHSTTGSAIIIHTPRSNQSWHPGQNNHFTLGGTGSGVTVSNLRIYEMIAEPYMDFADGGTGGVTRPPRPPWPWLPPSPNLTVVSDEVVTVYLNDNYIPLNVPMPVDVGQFVTFRVVPDDGYRLVEAVASHGELVEGVHGRDYYLFTFVMPSFDAEIELVFEPIQRVVRHGIEFEQISSDLSNLVPPVIHNVGVEVLDFIRGIYRITLSVDDCTLDSRAEPFFFWSAMEGRFSDIVDDQEDYASFIFSADPGTGGRDVYLLVGVGDGLGQATHVAVALKGNDMWDGLYGIEQSNISPFGLMDEFTFTPFATTIIDFPDVEPSHRSFPYIQELAQRGVISGFTDGTFRPEDNTTVAQFISMVIRLTEIPEETNVANFNDAMYNFAVSEGLELTRASMSENITREIAFRVLHRLLLNERGMAWNRTRDSEREQRPTTDVPFVDMHLVSESRIRTAIQVLWQYGILTGNTRSQINPLDYIKREDVVKILYKAGTPSGAIMHGVNMIRPLEEAMFERVELRPSYASGRANEQGAASFNFFVAESGYYTFTASNNFAPMLFTATSADDHSGVLFIPMKQVPRGTAIDGEARVQHYLQANTVVTVSVSGRAGQEFVLRVSKVFDVVWPVPTRQLSNSPFGYRIFANGRGYHRGIDIDGDRGTNIYAVMAGIVEDIVVNQTNEGTGNMIIILHENGFRTRYLHLDEVARGGFQVERGQIVEAGQLIGRMGNTGNSFGDHLHFELINNSNVQINPLPIYHPRSHRNNWCSLENENDTCSSNCNYECNCDCNYECNCSTSQNPNPFFINIDGEFIFSVPARFTAINGFLFNHDFCWDIAEEYYYVRICEED